MTSKEKSISLSVDKRRKIQYAAPYNSDDIPSQMGLRDEDPFYILRIGFNALLQEDCWVGYKW